MKTITKYQADDGTEFTDADKCKNYENLCGEVAAVMSRLPSRPENDGCMFANGNGYIQHSPVVFWSVWEDLLKLCQRYNDHPWVQQTLDGGANIDPSWVGRLLSECNMTPVRDAWYRIICTNQTSLREYGQPFYVKNEAEVKGGRINP